MGNVSENSGRSRLSAIAKHLFAGFCALWIPFSALAEIENPPGVFSRSAPCEAYLSFLDGNRIAGVEQCHPLARFLIDQNTDDVAGFLEAIAQFAGDGSTLGAMANTMGATLFLNPVLAYEWSEAATARLSVNLGLTRDVERIALYSHFLAEIRRAAMVSLCAEGPGCGDIKPVVGVSDILGKDFEYLNQLPPDFLFLCFLKSDAMVVPVRDVAGSRRLRSCVDTGFGG